MHSIIHKGIKSAIDSRWRAMPCAEAFPDEPLPSVLARSARCDGIADLGGLGPLLAPHGGTTSFVDAPVDLLHFCTQTDCRFGNPLELLSDRTYLPLFVTLGVLGANEWDAVAASHRTILLSEMSLPDRTSMKFCLQCVDRDLAARGSSFWRRTHNLRSTLICPEHGTTLFEYRPKRRVLHESLPMPADLLKSPEIRQVIWADLPAEWHRLALVARDAIKIGPRFDIGEVATETLHRAIVDRGLMNLRGKVDSKRAEGDLQLQFGRITEVISGALGFDPANPTFLKHALTTGSQTGADQRIFLVAWLFGDFGTFLEACRWSQAFPSALPSRDICSPHIALQDQFEAVREKRRSACNKFMTERPEATRSNFLRACYPDFKWLRQFDRAWLDRNLPAAEVRRLQLPLF